MKTGLDSLKTRRTLDVGGTAYDYFSLPAAADAGLGDLARLPFSLKVLLENLLRHEDGKTVTVDDLQAMGAGLAKRGAKEEIAFRPARVLLQDFTGVPAIVDLAAMREAMERLGGDPRRINPLSPVDLVIDHSVMVDSSGGPDAFETNVAREFERNGERYAFLKWGQGAFDNFRVVPPGTGICHQVNLEYLAQVVWTEKDHGRTLAYPDTLVGADSHTTMVNGLGVLGWGVGGIEAEAAMLGQPISMLIPEVIGLSLTGTLPEGTTATDLVLTVTQLLRARGVVGKFVEFTGDGLSNLSLADRATMANMAPEYGATCGFFPVDRETLRYLAFTGRDSERIALVEAYAKAQGLWREDSAPAPDFTDLLALDLGTVEPALAGPKRPQDKVPLSQAAQAFQRHLSAETGTDGDTKEAADGKLEHGAIVIAAITSCTNTSNPSVMVAAGLLAQKALAKGLTAKPWVKTSLAPGSQVVTDYLENAGLMGDLDQLGFNLVGYGCTTCIGNSGPLPEAIEAAIETDDLLVCSVLSGNRNFEGRIHRYCRANYLASPPLVVAYALAGSMKVDLLSDPLGIGDDGAPVYLRDLWPSNREVQAVVDASLSPEMFRARYGDVSAGPEQWRAISPTAGMTYDWSGHSTYMRSAPFFEDMGREPAPIADIAGARLLAVVGDSVTTDHISPAGGIIKDSPAGEYLLEHQVRPQEFNSYGARRGNHEIMMRGTFANIRIRNEMVSGVEGGFTKHLPDGEIMTIYDAAMKYQAEGVPLIVVAGKEYGTGSSRDWAAKGPRLLGLRAAIAESFERIHRSNLIGMGILPLQFTEGATHRSLGLSGEELFDLTGIAALVPGGRIGCRIRRPDGASQEVSLLCRIDTAQELEYYRHGGILHYVLRDLLDAA